jgi:diaminopimelate decarboxylase
MINRLIKTIKGLNASIETPFYLFDESILEDNYKTLCSLQEDILYRFSIAYSIKTNPLEVIALKAKACGAWAEATSITELQLAKKCGFEEIIFNGIYKTEKEMIYSAEIGATIILDGKNQISRICEIAKKIEKTIKVGIRLSSFPIMNDNGIRFGINANKSELKKLATVLISNKNIDLCCLHIHLGTNINDAKFYQLALEKLYKVGIISEDSGAFIRLYDIGW